MAADARGGRASGLKIEIVGLTFAVEHRFHANRSWFDFEASRFSASIFDPICDVVCVPLSL